MKYHYIIGVFCLLTIGSSIVLSDNSLSNLIGEAQITLEKSDSKFSIEELFKKKRYRLALERSQETLGGGLTEAKVKEHLNLIEKVTIIANAKVIKNKKTVFDRTISKKEAESLKITLPEDNDVEETLELFDELKKPISDLIILLEESLKNEPTDTNEMLLQQTERLKKEVKKARIEYLSYVVLSPYICEADRLAYMATGFWNDDEDGLMDAAKMLGKTCYHDWILQVSEDVRDQFLKAILSIKKNLNTSEWEDIKTHTSLTDSLDKSKKIGIDAWWE